MGLTSQERRCVELVTEYLSRLSGKPWHLDDGETPDELNPNTPSPDAIVTDNTQTAAVEVKRLTGDSVWNAYYESLRSLQRSLAPTSGGHWVLIPCDDFRLPMDAKTRRLVKKQIEAAKDLRPEEETVVRIPREAKVSLNRADGPGFIWCCHNLSGRDELRKASSMVQGNYLLVDNGQWEHSFVTDEGRHAFIMALVEACTRSRDGQVSIARWEEEWQLLRRDDLEPGQVDVLSVTEARSVPGANAEAVDLVLDDALRKFESRSWGDFQVIALDRDNIMLGADYLVAAVRDYPEAVFQPADLILIVDNADAIEAWRSTRLFEILKPNR